MKEHLGDLAQAVVEKKADFGIVVDPDVDRLAFMDESGEMFVKNTLWWLVRTMYWGKPQGIPFLIFLPLELLRDVTEAAGGEYFASAVGEVNVVTKMKEKGAVIGGEGNGGIMIHSCIMAEMPWWESLYFSHYWLNENAQYRFKSFLSSVFYRQEKLLTPSIDVDAVLAEIEKRYKNEQPLTIDGVKLTLLRVGCICENPTQNPSYGYIPKQMSG